MLTQALKEAGVVEVVLAINYQPKVCRLIAGVLGWRIVIASQPVVSHAALASLIAII